MLDFSWVMVALAGIAFSAGFVDAVVGGGGLIMVPGLINLFPNLPIPTLFGTNKVASIVGTSTAVWRYAKSVPFQWRWLLPAFLITILFAGFGGWLATQVSPQIFRPVILIFLLIVAWMSFRPSPLHHEHTDKEDTAINIYAIVVMCAVIGFYDGFIGPGTGVFLIYGFVRFFRLDFLYASAHAKMINVASNLGALAYFIPTGNVVWGLALMLAACNMSGAYLGSQMAIARGAPFVRWFFRVMVVALVGKFSWDSIKLL